MPNNVRIGIGVVDKASSELDRIKDKFTKLQSAGGKGILQGVGIAAGVMAFNALGSAIGVATDFLFDGIKAAREDEISVNRLTASLNANVKGWQAHSGEIQNAIKFNQKMAFSDDETRDSLALLVGATHDVTKALAIQHTAMDLARLKGISLSEASSALVKVEGGQFRALKALGIVLKDGATATDALAAVQKVAAGQMEAYSKTAQGSADRLNDSISELGETAGRVFTPILSELADKAAESVNALDDLTGSSDKTTAALQRAGKVTADYIASGLNVGVIAQSFMKTFGEIKAGADGSVKDAKDYGRDMSRVFEGAAPGMKKTVTAFYAPVWKQFDVAAFKAEQAARELPGQLADGILSGTDEIESAMGELTDIVKHPPDPHAKLTGALWSKELARGLASQNPYARAKAEALRLAILKELAAHYFFIGGRNAGRSFSQGIRSTSGNTNPNIRAKGGPVTKGQAYIVGEERPEVFVPNTSGTILPSVNSLSNMPQGTGSSSSWTLNLTVNTAPGMTPAAARGLGDAIGPSIYDYLYRRGAVGRAS